MIFWQVTNDVVELMNHVKQKHHSPRLDLANIAVCFNDSKPFVGERFNWGKTSKFSTSAKLWHPKDKKYDFQITLCGDAWLSILDGSQREALLDLHLERCQVEYVPEVIEVNGKKIPQKDEWGRVKYTDVVKTDEEGCPKWRVDKLDLNVFQENISRYGCWCADLLEFKQVVEKK